VRAQANEKLLAHIRRIYMASDGVMGAPRIWEELLYESIPCGQDRIARLMQVNGIQDLPQKKRWRKKLRKPA